MSTMLDTQLAGCSITVAPIMSTFDLLLCTHPRQQEHLITNEAFEAEVSIQSPRRVFVFNIKDIVTASKHPKIELIQF